LKRFVDISLGMLVLRVQVVLNVVAGDDESLLENN